MGFEDASALLARDAARRRRRRLATGLVVAAAIASLAAIGFFDPARYAGALANIAIIMGEMLPPDFSRVGEWWPAILDTLAMSIAATALAVAAALPVGLLSARALGAPLLVNAAARAILAALRAVPELVLAVLLVAAVGFGALSGAVALALHSLGMLGKFFNEIAEHVEPDLIELSRSTGADRFGAAVRVVLPAILPRLADVVVYRWEHNVRASTVLGMVGAGGIGFELIAAFRILDYAEAAAIMLVILFMVLAVDAIGARLRRVLS